MINSNELVKQANQFILEKLLNIYNLKKTGTTAEAYEKFKTTFEGKEVMNEIEQIYKYPKKALILAAGKDNSCVPVTKEMFKKIQKKGVLILKTSKEQPISEDMHQNFLFIELSKNILEQMYLICKEMFYPMLAQSVYQGDSSELISKELMEKFHNFLAHFYVVLGHIKKKTLLPIPSEEIFRNPKINDNEKTQICEGAVVMWIELIKHILKQEPEFDFRNGANPDPVTEITFWEKKSVNLESILNQIQSEQVIEILKFLEKQKSSYHKFFNDIKKEVIQKSKEASQNFKFLSFLRNDFNDFTADKLLPELTEFFIPIFHTIRLIWKDNEYYSKPERLIVLIRKICNSLIDQASNYIGQGIFNKIIDQDSITEAITKLETTRDVIGKFMTAYFSYKDNDMDGWKITRNVIFYRLDSFNDRIGDILNIAKSYSEFIKVSSKFIGGIKGDSLMNMLLDIFTECTKAVKEFKEDCQPLDINSDDFNHKYSKYKATLKELERRIAAVLTQTFDECDTIIGKFKILENFDTILERPNIVVELEKKYNFLLDLYKGELRTVQNLFQFGSELIKKNDPKSPLNKNMPPIAALLYWTDSLKERINEPYMRFIAIGKRITEKEEFREIENLYHSIIKMLNEYEISRKQTWDNISKTASGDKQKDFILVKKGELLQINFDPQLLQLLKEIKYLKILNLDIPAEAEAVYQKNKEFRKHISSLESITSQYNNIIISLNEVEKPMVQEKLNKVEVILEPAFNQITWEKTKDIEGFVTKAANNIGDLATIVEKLKNFVGKIVGIFKDWKEKLRLFKRPEKRSDAFQLNEYFSAQFDVERTNMVSKSKDFTSLSEVQNALKTAVSNLTKFIKDSDSWKNYLHYINSIIINGLKDFILVNLNFLYTNFDPNLDPFCSVRMLLEERKLVFEPELNENSGRLSIKGMVLGWINSFLNLCTISRTRVDSNSPGDYMLEILENFEIQEIVYKLYNEVNELINESDTVIDSFKEYKVLWEKDFEVSFRDFLKQYVVVPEETPEQQERNERIAKIFGKEGNPILKGVVENTPPKEIFDDKINELKNMLKKAKNMRNEVKIRWIVIDFTFFQTELVKIIENWIDEYKSFLSKNSKNKIKNINDFMTKVRRGISDIPNNTENDNAAKFINLLENIRDMNNLHPKIVEIIPSIKGELEILKKHSRSDNEDDFLDSEEKEMESEEYKMLMQTEEISKDIVTLNKDVEEVYQNINDLIEKESTNFKITVDEFRTKVETFRAEFNENIPNKLNDFSVEEIDNAYKILDNYYEELQKLEEEKKKNNNMEMLLGLTVSQNKQIADCLNDLNMYKLIWDYVALVFNTFESWKKIKMDKVDANDLSDKIDLFKAQLKMPVKKEIKSNPVFASLVKRVNNMEDIISVIRTLKERAIKTRHWKHLMEVTGKILPYDNPDFSVESLIKLEMHEYKDKCEEEKNIAVEQEKIEIAFNKIDKHWQSQAFMMTKKMNNKEYDFYLFDHTKMEVVIENLGKDQVTLIQNTQKKTYLENFEGMDTKINQTLNQLRTVNDVIKTWLKFQKNWEKLETIFLNAEDIRNKLGDEYNKFKELDVKFKEEMKIAYDFNTMILVCNEERKLTLMEMTRVIEDCERALENYLEDKKKIFPRFYFLSNDTLLNMLSYGEYPNIINKNVKDCFDGIKSWAMTPVNEKNKSKTVLGMLSAENGEEVLFQEPFDCGDDLVEVYLGRFEDKMRKTLKDVLYKAKMDVNWDTYSGVPVNQEKNKANPRHKWLEPYPAQLALLVTQNVWTDEVEHVFEEQENGLEGIMKEYYEENVRRITKLIDRVKGDVLSDELRVKIITIITVDVHARDVVQYFLEKKIPDSNNFNWKKQLRFKYSKEQQDVSILIADYVTIYSYEYIGNTGRLVITPLTDRCYITLTQALNLTLGGAPAGPAGTGKTETTKDLGRNLGLGVIVNNCSDQMDIDTTARIFSGLAQTGFWGCFDEFNRISIEVLSVVSSQVKSILDAMRTTHPTFQFEGTEIRLVKTCGFFITMNPGYAGRTELPDNLKALFRSCAMVVPNLENICENMLMSEGFIEAKKIARKFITLYTLSRDLLSKQKHYDWGLRAIKSLLRQAGKLKRHPLNQGKPEEMIIMNALYDFNKAKIVPDDLVIFRRLLDDLFKENTADSKGSKDAEDVNQELNAKIEEATEEIKLQKDASFTLKARQLQEILEVRHCMFILGNPGSGKTAIWKTLFHTWKDFYNMEAAYDKLSPKAITGNELFGSFDKNKMWRFGILSSIMKKMCKNDPPYKDTMKKKWIILDGDIDPDWIESLNTVMDDNKVLTLNNGDRFPLDEFMRLIFEISNLRNATLATVSRGGVLYVNDSDIGTKPYFEKWIKTKYSSPAHEITKSVVQLLFGETFNKIKGDFKERYIAPMVEMNLVQNVCTIFQNLIEEAMPVLNDVEDEKKKLIVEGLYFFAFMWGAGGGLIDRKDMATVVNQTINKRIAIPHNTGGTCFDYFFDVKNCQWQPWSSKLPEQYEVQEGALFQDIIIPNVEVMRLSKIVEINVLEEKPVLFIGDAGTGKSAIAKYFLKSTATLQNSAGFTYKYFPVNFNSFTDSYAFQMILESQVSVRFSNRYGPLGTQKLVYFLDDFNMPGLDKYGTQSHVELLRQLLDYKEIFDRKMLEEKKILEDVLFVGCQNPKAGSFKIDLRLQRHFTILSPTEPKSDIITEIYTPILKNHFRDFRFKSNESIDNLVKELLNGCWDILGKIKTEKCFYPSATKFHYQWNLREIAKIVEGLLRTNNTFHKDVDQIYRLWLHECNRVFKDRLIHVEDLKRYDDVAYGAFDRAFLKYNSVNKKEEVSEPFIFVPFDDALDETESILVQPKDFNTLKDYITNKLEDYNSSKGNMPLVLFDDAIMHISRIARIISNPSSHALLVGVGGSGKQSLSRLAAFIKATNVKTPNLTGDYNREKLLEDFKVLILDSVLRNTPRPFIFLMNDNHILEEYFLVYVNNFLSSSWVEDMYENKSELETQLQKIRMQAISEGFMTPAESSSEKIFEFLLYRIKMYVHLILCVSPVGDKLRVRARKFPGILSCTNIDWFHEWPDTALEKVAGRFIESMEQFQDENVLRKLSQITCDLHKSIKGFNDLYFAQERRHNYTTPKSYLELLSFFQLIVTKKDTEIENQLVRLEKGLSILATISELIAGLKVNVEEKSVEVEIEKAKTNKILEELVVEQEKIDREQAIVGAAADEAAKKSAQAAIDEKEAATALAEAEPAKESARLNAQNLDPKKLDEFKKGSNPSPKIMDVFKLLYMLLNTEAKQAPNELTVIKSKCLNIDSNTIKKQLLEKLENIEWLDEAYLAKMEYYRKDPFTEPKKMAEISLPAQNIAGFFQACVLYKKNYDIVKPLKERAENARAVAEESLKKKEELEKAFAIILAKKKEVEDRYEVSKAAKEKVEAEQKRLMDKLEMAEKFINLLSGNKIRWEEEVKRLKEFKMRLAGDCMMASAFVSYIGVFNSFFRERLIEKWQSIITSKDVLITPNIDVVRILITDSQMLKFKAEGLPPDPFSIENSAIITSCTRWPLIVDPQMQAIKWLKGMTGKKTLIQYKQPEWEQAISNAINSGEILIMEDVDQELDPLLTPILGKETYTKEKGSKTQYIKVGSEECEFNPKVRIYFVTKISNPHYKPEIIAQCTLINFIVTEKGLEDQLLAMVVNIEQPELEETIKKCIDEINEFQAELILKEDDVLRNLKEADPNTILENIPLVNSLESTKARAQEIEEKSKITEDLIKEINTKREFYRKVGIEGAMLFFLISKLFVVQHMYQYSLESFNYFFTKAINNTEKSENLTTRINNLTENIRVTIYLWVSSGMFEKDKQLFLTMISLRLLQKKTLTHEDVQGISKSHIDFLLKCPRKLDSPPKENSLAWMDDGMWMSLNYLSDLDGFNEFATRMQNEQSTKFREWYNEANPEDNQYSLPLEWRKYKKHSFHKILVLRACRPDRVSVALSEFVKICLPRGREFLEARTFSDVLAQAYNDSSPETPIFFILSPGSNPIKELEVLGKKVNPKKKFELGKNFFSVAMGQKADEKAEALLASCNTDGHWLFLQNIHLMPKWLKKLQDKLKELAKEKGNEDFRIFLSAEPRVDIPVGILEKCIKLTNEPPSGLKENMKIAFNTLKLENPNIDDKRRMNVMFGLSYFHSVVLERKKFGSLGWNRNYPFNLDDLRASDAVVAKYLDLNPGNKIPWDDLRYIVGEIMYGGHIVDDWDRILNNAYLEFLLTEKINEDLDLIPYPTNKSLSLKTPANNPNFPFEKWSDYIDKTIDTESPALFGLHPNAELDYRVQQSENLFQNLIDLEPKDSSGGSGGDENEGNRFDKIKAKCEDITAKSNDGIFNIEGLKSALGDDKTPYQNVFIQECEQMKNLCELVKRNTNDIKAAIDGQLTMNEVIEALIDNLYAERVPPKWVDEGFATNRKLASWLISLELRISQYKIFEGEQLIPRIVFINRLFNPLSYLTAIRQVAARKNDAELDKLQILTEPTSIDLRVSVDNLVGLPKENSGIVPIYGLHLQGARWNVENRTIEESKPREEYCVMPVINCKVVDNLKQAEKGYYTCPVYKTTKRDATYVTSARFGTELPPAKWIIAGVAAILDVEKTDSITKYPK